MPCRAATYHVRPDGDNANSGSAATPAEAWRSVDRGQPARLLADVKEGDTAIELSKASQFPAKGTLLVGKELRITYTGRSAQRVTGCQGVKTAKKGSPVSCPDAPPPAAGDTVLVAPGVYAETLAQEPTGSYPYPLAAVAITSGGAKGEPVVFKGLAGTIIDGRDEIIGVALAASHVVFEGFEVRKGGVWANRADNVVLRSCAIHGGNKGISFHYVSNAQISGNIVYDIVGAWSQHGVGLDSCNTTAVTRNTVVANAHGVSVTRGSGNQITRNLISWCRFGIVFDQKNPPQDCLIKANNIWACGRWTWLQKDNDSGKDYYKNVAPSLAAGDTHVEPMIAQWTAGAKDFLCPSLQSPLVSGGAATVGARPPAPYPDAGHKPGENLIFNPSFASGLLGWNVSSWMHMSWNRTGWRVVDDPAAMDGLCLELWDLEKAAKAARLRVASQFFRYTKGRPLTLSFRAKAIGDETVLGAGFVTPSWQMKSGVGTKFKLTRQWAIHTWTTTLPPRFSDYAAAIFTTISGQCRIDAVKVEEGEEATPFSPELEFAPRDSLAMMIEPKCPLQGRVINRTGRPFAGTMHWMIEAPLRGVVAKGAKAIDAGSHLTEVAVDVMKAKPIEGYFLFCYAFDVAGAELGRGMCRFTVGRHATPCRRQDFFAATPSYEGMIPGAIFDRQAATLQAIGLGTLHLYLGYDRINEAIASPKFAKLLDATESHNLQWLFTPSDANALTGKATWAPGPGNVGPDAIETRRSDLGGGVCTPAQLAAWSQAVGLLASTYKGRVKYWEVLNEPNTFLTGPEYAKVLAITSETLRKNDPGALIIGGSVVNAHRHDLYRATMAAAPGTFDFFSYHPYRFGLLNPESEKESFRKTLLETKTDLAAAGHKTLIFLTEEGMASGLDETRAIGGLLSLSHPIARVDFGEGEIQQCQYLARMYATALGEGCIAYSYHTLANLTWDVLGNPQLGLKALHTMREMLGDAAPLGRAEVGRYHVCYLFEARSPAGRFGRLLPPKSRIVAALWAKDAEYATPVAMTLPGGFDCLDMLGFPLSTRAGGATSFPLGRELLYLVFDGVNAGQVRTVLASKFAH
jgi:parallel beta-helix repeat protein